MGNIFSTLPTEDALEISKESKFTPDQVQKLYQRFTRLDRDGSGTLNSEEFLAIPEFAMNPLAQRILIMFFIEQQESLGIMNGSRNTQGLLKLDSQGQSLMNIEVDFRTFVKVLSIFNPSSSREEKLKFAFNVYDVDQDGYINPSDLFNVLKLMVGENLKDAELQTIVDKTMAQACLHEKGISFEQFLQIFSNKDIDNEMTITL